MPMNRGRRQAFDETGKEHNLDVTLNRKLLQRIAQRLAVDVEVVCRRAVLERHGGEQGSCDAERQQ
jgi:hypothetical protein